MKLYKISQRTHNDYDTYDSAVVCAENEDDARHIHPSSFVTHFRDGKWYGTHSSAPFDEYESEADCYNESYSSWVLGNQLDSITVEYIGEADESQTRGVVVASFNAG